MSEETGGPAFPGFDYIDQYATGLYVGDLDNDSEVVAANSAYIMADAMLRAREVA